MLGDLTRATYTLLYVVEQFDLPGYAPVMCAVQLDTQMTQAVRAERQRYLDDLAQPCAPAGIRFRRGRSSVHSPPWRFSMRRRSRAPI